MTVQAKPERADPHRRGAKIQLLLRTPDGGRWGLTLSSGMERFVGHFPRVAGFGSGGPLLRYSPIGTAAGG